MQDNQQSYEQTNISYYLKESIFWIYNLFMILYGIIMVSLLASGVTEIQKLQDSQSFIIASETINQWNIKFISDIQISPVPCPNGYESWVNYEWPGTLEGCGCSFEIDNYNQVIVIKGKCSSELLGYGCYDVNPQQSEILNQWKNGQYVCIQRNKLLSLASTNDSACTNDQQANFKKCGTGQRAVCVDSTQTCPITYFSNQSTQIMSQQTGSILSVGPTIQYYYESETIGYLPIMQFRLDEYGPCLNPKRKNISPSKKGEYVLLTQRREFCDKIDSRTVFIDYIGEEDLFKTNMNLWKKLTQALPGYQRPSNDYNWTIYFQPYPLWTFDCRANSQFSISIATRRLQLTTEQQNMTHLLATTIISVCFVSFFFIIIEGKAKIQRQNELARIKTLKSDEKYYKQTQQYITVLHQSWLRSTQILIVLDRLFKLLNIASIFIVYLDSQKAQKWFEDVTQLGCGDQQFYSQIGQQYLSTINQVYRFFGAMMGFWWFVFIIDWIYLLFKYQHEIKPIIDDLRGRTKRFIPNKQIAPDEEFYLKKNDQFDEEDNITNLNNSQLKKQNQKILQFQNSETQSKNFVAKTEEGKEIKNKNNTEFLDLNQSENSNFNESLQVSRERIKKNQNQDSKKTKNK